MIIAVGCHELLVSHAGQGKETGQHELNSDMVTSESGAFEVFRIISSIALWAAAVGDIEFPDGSYVMDSAAIAVKLESLHPEPSLHLNTEIESEAQETRQIRTFFQLLDVIALHPIT